MNDDIIMFEQNLACLDSRSLHHFLKCEMVVLFSVDQVILLNTEFNTNLISARNYNDISFLN